MKLKQQSFVKTTYDPVMKQIYRPNFLLNDTVVINSLKKNTIPGNYYSTNMGMVCKIELKVQKQIKFPLYFRMGNKEYVDRLEGK